MFIVFEGLDGSGKSCQVKRLVDYLSKRNIKTWVTTEPTDSEIGKLIRRIQKGECIPHPDRTTMMCLYAADRSVHINEIQEHINNGDWVICDRYMYSSIAYQDQDLTKGDISAVKLNKNFLKPDITFILDVDENTSLERIKARGNSQELFEKAYILKKARRKYLRLSQENPKNTFVIDGTLSEKEVFDNVLKIIEVKGDL